MSKKIAFITGGNRGLGFETARELAEKGVHVVIGSRDEVQGQAAAKKLRDKGFAADAVVFDVRNREDHKTVAAYLQEKFGRLDILINNAGIMLDSRDASADRTNRTSTPSPEILHETFEVNFFAPVALTQTLLPLLRKSDAGRIVNLSSILGSLTLHADPNSPIYDGKVFAYDASKTALNAFTVHLAHELQNTKIKVNSAHPGWIKTEMGGPTAPTELSEGGKTSAELALVPDDGPSGAFIHLGESLPW
jgi:NAD(P)-dependent dehydrogenase (short-subunit alcohol dehydrogenase family)